MRKSKINTFAHKKIKLYLAGVFDGPIFSLCIAAVHEDHGVVWTEGRSIFLAPLCCHGNQLENTEASKLGEFEWVVCLFKLFQTRELILGKLNKYMLCAMTKPALMTFSKIEAFNFYFNAKLTDFEMFLYRSNISLTYCSMYRDYETHGYLLLHIL